jgi:transglutaminase 1
MQLDETGKAKRCSDGWSCHLIKNEDCTVDIEVHPPANIAIGDWSFSIITKTRGQRKSLCFEHKDNFFILFNPWCKGK